MEEGPIKEYKPYLFHKKHKTNSIKNNCKAPIKKIPTVIDAIPKGYESQNNIFLIKTSGGFWNKIINIPYFKYDIPSKIRANIIYSAKKSGIAANSQE